MKKLLIICKSLQGGTGTYTLHLSSLGLYSKNKWVIEVLVLESDNNSHLRDKLKINSRLTYLNPYRVYPKKFSIMNSIFTFIQDLVKVYLFLRIKKPNYVISVNFYVSSILGILKYVNLISSNIVYTHHNNYSSLLEGRVTKPLKIIVYKIFPIVIKSGIHVSVSQELKVSLQKYLNINNIHFIPNGILFNKSVSLQQSVPASGKIISIGRFEKQKDFITLIQAFNLVLLTHPRARLIIAGDGPERASILDCISKHKLEPTTTILPWQNNVDKLLEPGSIYILSSFYEGFPYVILEAMAKGIPVIATKVKYGPSEILGDGVYGLLVPVSNPKEMAGAIELLLKNKNRYKHFSNQAKIRISSYSLKSMLSAYEDLLISFENSR